LQEVEEEKRLGRGQGWRTDSLISRLHSSLITRPPGQMHKSVEHAQHLPSHSIFLQPAVGSSELAGAASCQTYKASCRTAMQIARAQFKCCQHIRDPPEGLYRLMSTCSVKWNTPPAPHLQARSAGKRAHARQGEGRGRQKIDPTSQQLSNAGSYTVSRT